MFLIFLQMRNSGPEGFGSYLTSHSWWVVGLEGEPVLFPLRQSCHLGAPWQGVPVIPSLPRTPPSVNPLKTIRIFMVGTARLSKNCVRPHSCLITLRNLMKEMYLKQEK